MGMRRFWPLLLLAAIFLYAVMQSDQQTSREDTAATFAAQRIISLAPSITETLFAVGAAAQVVAVTDYCSYPEEAKALPKVGGYLDPALERILRLEPDLVILLSQQRLLKSQLTQLGIQTLAIDTTSLSGILDSIRNIGIATGHNKQAHALLEEIDLRIAAVTERVAARPKPLTLLAIAHYTDSDHLHHVYLAGQQDFYNDLLTLAGGQNVYQGTRLKVPSISTEGILRLNPEVIIDLFPAAEMHHYDLQQIEKNWYQLHQLDAVKQQQVHLIEASYATLPGPRVIDLLEDIVVLLHPDTEE